MQLTHSVPLGEEELHVQYLKVLATLGYNCFMDQKCIFEDLEQKPQDNKFIQNVDKAYICHLNCKSGRCFNKIVRSYRFLN